MRSFTLIDVLFIGFSSWMCESQTLEVQSGEDVTLLCSNISTSPTHTDWFRVVNRSKPSCISSMFYPDHPASLCDGYLAGKFEMSSNISTTFLKIKQVDFSDSGFYFCGFYINQHTVIYNATELIVGGITESKDEKPNSNVCVWKYFVEKAGRPTFLMSVILGALTAFLTLVVVVLAVKIRTLQSAANEEQIPERSKLPRSEDLNYAALSFQTKGKRGRRTAAEREMEPNVVYAATR
ncbi:uncharacterized protein LOC133420453 [Cololabis saira]|uniref:uncharacterized protein LOC133420453 n=1 Tax=Cololabis saira TaxID=129043 RepID=UPI002AD1F07F|nr:uncharacterized protein LOC133420453 [Cololabis saira]